MTKEAQMDALAEDSMEEIERCEQLKALGIRPEEIRVHPDLAGYGWSATVGDYDLGDRVGTGKTPDAAIDDLIAQLD
jgi:hypothetical protein